jgi:hypothetical protein
MSEAQLLKQTFLSQLPKQGNREKIRKNREFFQNNERKLAPWPLVEGHPY